MLSLQSCGPCDCAQYGSRTVYNVTAQPIQQWLSQTNAAGRNHGMNPVTFLAIASLESNGNYAAVDPSGTTYGIVQIGQNILDAYNCWKGTNYQLTDLIGEGPNVTTSSGAVALSFDVLGKYMGTLNGITNSYRLTATGWNGAICGTSGSFQPYGANCGYWPVPSGASCYGEAAYKLASAYSGWWINPNTGNPDSFYFGPLSSVPTNTLPTYNQACYGP